MTSHEQSPCSQNKVVDSAKRRLSVGKITANVIEETSAATDGRINEEASRMLKLKLEENLWKQEIERIAEENLLQGTNMFAYPPPGVKPDRYRSVS